MGPPIRKREGEKWTAPDVLKGWKNQEKRKRKEEEGEREKEKKELEKTRTGRFRKRRGESRSFCSVMLNRNPKRE
ncbi:hypothetical protein TNCV_2593541 [Trichonephila clavipes]|nr:hypothetical protein TNCV_2593541 [Trichonephila clavipes]